MDWLECDLDLLAEQIWDVLESGVGQPGAAFWTAALGTFGPEGCLLRTMVVRRVIRENRELLCCSDFRTEKIRQIQSNPGVQWLFFDPEKKLQIRAEAQAVVHQGDALATREWDNTPVARRAHYASALAPGTLIPSPAANAGPVSGADGSVNFAIIRSVVHVFDWFLVHPSGNRRARLTWDGAQFSGVWLAA